MRVQWEFSGTSVGARHSNLYAYCMLTASRSPRMSKWCSNFVGFGGGGGWGRAGVGGGGGWGKGGWGGWVGVKGWGGVKRGGWG